MSRKLLSVLLAAAGLAAAAWVFLSQESTGPGNAPADLPPSRAEGPGTGVLVLRPGDRLFYAPAGPGVAGGGLEVRFLAPRAVLGANLTSVEAVPALFGNAGPGTGASWLAALTDLSRGGLAVLADGCLLDADLPCSDRGDTTQVSWQECPFNAAFGTPLDAVPRDAFAGSSLTVQDPVKGTTWTYALRAEGPGRVRATLQGSSGPRAYCGGLDEALLDLDRGLFLEVGSGSARLRLTRVERGAGLELRVGGGPAAAAPLVAPEAPRRQPYPPGAEALGDPVWPLGEAWDRAKAGAPALSSFLGSHPEAFLTEASNTSSAAGVTGGPSLVVTHEWHFALLAADRSALDVRSAKVVVQGVPRHEASAAPGQPPTGAPATVRPPADHVADLQAFARRVADAGFQPSAAFPDPGFSVRFDGEDTDYIYTLHVGAPQVVGGGAAQTRSSAEFLSLNADTGRLETAQVPRAEARRIVQPPS